MRLTLIALLLLSTLTGCQGSAQQSASDQLLKDLDSPDVEVRRAVALMLKNAPTKAALPALVKGLKDTDHLVQQDCIVGLSKLRPDVEEALPALAALFHDKKAEEHVRSLAATCLAQISPKSLPLLAKSIKDEEIFVRKSAADCLGRFNQHGNEGLKAIPVLIDALGDKDEDVQTIAVGSLRDFGKKAVPELVAALKHQQPLIRVGAAEVLLRLDEKHATALQAALAHRKDPDALVRLRVMIALGDIEDEALVPLKVLVEALDDSDARVRLFALFGVTFRCPKETRAIPALIKSLSDSDAEVRLLAVKGLDTFGPQAKEAIPALINALQDKHPDVQGEAITALRHIGPPAKPTIPALRKLLDDPRFREDAQAAIEAIENEPEK